MTELLSTEIAFPLKGLFYGDKMPGGVASVRPWRTSEIKLLVAARKGSSAQLERTLDTVVNRCLDLPPGIKHPDLLYSDGFYALVMQRIFTYSTHFRAEFKCSECGFKNTKVWIDLNEELDTKEPPEGAQEPIEVSLPILDVLVDLKLLRRSDTQRVARYSKTKMEKAPELGDPSYSYRLALQVLHIDGEKMDLGQKLMWVDSLHARDLAAIESKLDDYASGINPVVSKICIKCREETNFILPMNMEFFRPRFTQPTTDP